VIHPALLLLVRMRWRAMFRKTVRGIGTVRGALLFLLGLSLVILWLLPTVMLSLRGERGDVESFRTMIPLGMLGMCLLSLMTSAGERAIYFSPGEVEFLFPGPFSRREVLAYKLLGTAANVLIGSLIFSVFVLRYASSWFAGYVGVVLALLFVQYFTMAAMILGETMSQRAYTRARKIILFIFGALLAVIAGQVMSMRADARDAGFLLLLKDSPWVQYLLMPLAPFARVMTAESLFPDLALWAAVCVAMNATLFFVIVGLDAEYRETAIRISQRIYTRIQHAQRSGMAPAVVKAGKRRMPLLPWWGGTGPIIWRQCVNAIRNSRSMLMITILLTVAVAVPAMRNDTSERGIATILTMLIWLTVMMSMMIRFDFRADIERMDWLKVLPIPPLALSAGQLVVPVAICTALQVYLTAIATYFMGRQELIPLMLVFGLPTNLLMFAAENTLFLLMPTKSAAFSPGDFQMFGRQLIFLLVKTLIVGAVWGLSFLAGAAVYFLTGQNTTAGGVAVWCCLTVAAIGCIAAVAWAFGQYDVSRDTPA